MQTHCKVESGLCLRKGSNVSCFEKDWWRVRRAGCQGAVAASCEGPVATGTERKSWGGGRANLSSRRRGSQKGCSWAGGRVT